MTRILGDYNIIKKIGQGSLGSVFLAEHRFMKRQYVLKVLPEELATNRAFIQRFEEEVALLGALDHPHIVKIHNVSLAQGAYFLVIDCVVDPIGETTNLFQYLTAHEELLDEQLLLHLLRQVAQGLDYAHSRQNGGMTVIHRGLKLNNILVGQDQGRIKLCLSDMGLSRIVGTGAVLNRMYKTLSEALGVVSTVEGDNKGVRYPLEGADTQKSSMLHSSFLQSFMFLAPEQKRAVDAANVDFKVDSYAFGVLAYYLIAREFPEGVFDSILEVAPTYQMNWDKLINACLQKRPEKRPAQLEEALDILLRSDQMETWSGIVQDAKAMPLAENPLPGLPVEAASEVPFDASGSVFSSGLQQPSFSPQPTVTAQLAPSVAVGTHSHIGGSVIMQAPPAVQSPVAGQQVVPEAFAPKAQSYLAPSHPVAHMQATLHEPVKPVLQEQKIERPTYDPDPALALRVDSTVKQYNPKDREEKTKNVEPLMTDMVMIKGGEFRRGSNEGNRDEMPAHSVHIDSFAIDIHPVTNEQFIRFLTLMGGEKDANNLDIIRLKESRINRSAGRLTIESGYSKHPVVGVTWYGSVAYAKWIGKRLPTEVEWEIAARGGLIDASYPCGDSIEKSQANFFSSDTTAVMSYVANGFGLFDMVGNVYEWCQDWYGYNYYETSMVEPDEPKGPLQGVYRVLRGGCWKSLKEDLRTSHRHRNNPGTVNRTYGFRCVADVQ